MTASRSHRRLFPLVCLVAVVLTLGTVLRAEEEPDPSASSEVTETQSADKTAAESSEAAEETPPPARPVRARRVKRKTRRKYLTETPGRVDAGVFHVGFAAGGNIYIEPQINASSRVPLGDYYKDLGFQAGVYFDYDYSESDSNIPLALRGMVGYKYILSSVHVFAVDAVARRMIRLSESTSLGLGGGVSAAIWYRAVTDTSPNSEVLFLPSVVLNAGFDFKPFMVDFKWLINRIAADDNIMGWELYFGVRI